MSLIAAKALAAVYLERGFNCNHDLLGTKQNKKKRKEKERKEKEATFSLYTHKGSSVIYTYKTNEEMHCL